MFIGHAETEWYRSSSLLFKRKGQLFSAHQNSTVENVGIKQSLDQTQRYWRVVLYGIRSVLKGRNACIAKDKMEF